MIGMELSKTPELSRETLGGLVDAGTLTPHAWEESLRFCGFTPGVRQWTAYWRHMFLLGGALFLAAGIIFFFAWNWAEMHRFARMALAGLAVAATGIGAVWHGPDSPLGRVLLLACGICVGPMLAVFGQTYQTGAELWELFRVWTVLLVALAVVGKQPALWFVAWLSGNVFVMLWLGRSMDSPLEAIAMFSLLPECVLALAAAVAAWEGFAYRAARRCGGEQSWLASRWFPRLLFFDLTVRLTAFLVMDLFGGSWFRYHSQAYFQGQGILLPLLALVVAGASWHWHRKRVPDLFMPACLVSACAVLLVAALLRMEFLFYADISAVLLWGVLLVAITAAVAKILLSLQRQMETRRDGTAARPALPGVDFFGPARSLPDWETLWAHLQKKELLAADSPLPRTFVGGTVTGAAPEATAGAAHGNAPEDAAEAETEAAVGSVREAAAVNTRGVTTQAAPAAPWFVRAILAVGGWVSAVVLLVFLALGVAMGGGGGEGASLLGASLVPLGIAGVALKSSGVFAKNFGFSLALAGSAAACIGLGLLTRSPLAAQFLAAAVLAGLCAVLDSAAFRFLAGACVVLLVAGGLMSVGMPGMDPWSGYGDTSGLAEAYRRGSYLAVAWWTAVAFAIATARLREGEWRTSGRAKILEPFCFGAYGGMMLALIFALSMRVGLLRELGIHGVLLPGSWSVGVGAAAGLVFFVRSLTGNGPRSSGRMVALCCAALCLPLGWFLPGAALAAFGLTLSRYMGGLVMQGCTAAFLFVYMVHYYYFLGISLMYKSLLLGCTGLVLLALAFGLRRFAPQLALEFPREARHA